VPKYLVVLLMFLSDPCEMQLVPALKCKFVLCCSCCQ